MPNLQASDRGTEIIDIKHYYSQALESREMYMYVYTHIQMYI